MFIYVAPSAAWSTARLFIIQPFAADLLNASWPGNKTSPISALLKGPAVIS